MSADHVSMAESHSPEYLRLLESIRLVLLDLTRRLEQDSSRLINNVLITIRTKLIV